MPMPRAAAQKCSPGACVDVQHLSSLTEPPRMLRPVQSSLILQRRVLTVVGVEPDPGFSAASQLALQLELPPWNIAAPPSGSMPPVNAIVPQQYCMPEPQSSGPSHARTAPPEQSPPVVMQVDDVVVVPDAITQQL